MKQLNLPFKIDKQYENWEFELDALDDRLSGYHSYKYIGKQLNYFQNFITYKTELIFNGDYLTAVIVTIKNVDVKQFTAINQFLEQNASKVTTINSCVIKFKVWRISYISIYYSSKNEAVLIYGKPRFINRLIKLFLATM